VVTRSRCSPVVPILMSCIFVRTNYLVGGDRRCGVFSFQTVGSAFTTPLSLPQRRLLFGWRRRGWPAPVLLLLFLVPSRMPGARLQQPERHQHHRQEHHQAEYPQDHPYMGRFVDRLAATRTPRSLRRHRHQAPMANLGAILRSWLFHRLWGSIYHSRLKV